MVKKYLQKTRTHKKSVRLNGLKKVTDHSDAMDLEKDVFKLKDPTKIAESIKRSAEKSKRRKAEPFQSAMSMINFYENRGGKNIPASQRKILDALKNELRKLFGRDRE